MLLYTLDNFFGVGSRCSLCGNACARTESHRKIKAPRGKSRTLRLEGHPSLFAAAYSRFTKVTS